MPCQAGYGSCAIYPPPSCPQGDGLTTGSSSGRKIGYFQSWNLRERACDTRHPFELNLKGYTHLFYAFAFIDPTSFEIVPAHADDEYMMKDFVSLSEDGSLQTWIAIGGFDFSNPGLPTHTTW